jgi:hypothetical protein
MNSHCTRRPQTICDKTTLTCVECVTGTDCRSGQCNYLGSCIDFGPSFDRDAAGQGLGNPVDAAEAATASDMSDGG